MACAKTEVIKFFHKN